MVTADYIVNGLMQRGLPEHVARGFAINMQDESGLNPGINEIAPLVPGSRGGFGLYQLTGPRRKAYEAFAAQRGVDPADPDAQLDFLMTELQGPEARAAKSILGAKDVSGAATAIARDFLRPAPENLQKRVAKYGGAGGTQMQPTVSTQGRTGSAAPMQAEDQPKWKNPDLWANLAIAFNSMRMRPDAGLAQAMRSGIESRASERKAAQNRNKTADWLESQGAVDLAAGVRGGAVPATTGLSMYQVQAKAASDPNVQASQMLPDASGSVLTMRDGSLRVVTSGGETLTGQEAMDFVRQAQERGVQYEREKFGARRQGTLGADIEMGSEAEAAKAWGKEAPKVVGEFAERAGLVRSNISNIDDAIAAIDEGAESGIVYNMLPNITEASASLNNAMNRMGLDVIGSVTFGALSEGEMRLAMETAVPRNLSPTELRSWLVKKREAQAKAYAALNEAIQFIASGRSPAEYYSTFGAGEGAKPKQAAPSSGDLSDEDLLKKYGG